ncbi:DMT family transporter [Candidatus Woesearchaeota archaeon]|nr:DMT family transporter [Candidatus Woesearchaeota archaeon]
MHIPIMATIAATCGLLYTKYLLTKRRMDYISYAVQSFWAILLLLVPGSFYVRPPWPLPPIAVFEFLLLVTVACMWNLLFFHGMKEEALVESQLVAMIVPLLAALFGFFFFADERKLTTLLFLAIGVGALVWSHVYHHHLRWSHGSRLLVFAGFLIAAEGVLVKLLLPFFSVYWLYFARVAGITLVFTILFPQYIRPHSFTMALHMGVLGVMVIAQFLFTYTAFGLHGLVMSNLFFSIIPVLVGAGGVIFFHEHISHKKMLAAMVLLVCVVLAQFF